MATRDPEGVKKRILAAALKEFSAKGMAGARMDVIAAKAKCSKQMPFYYFGSKAKLFREILRLALDEERRRARVADNTLRDQLVESFEAHVADPASLRLLIWEGLEWDGKRKLIDEAERSRLYEMFSHWFEQQRADGHIASSLDASEGILVFLALTTMPLAFPQLTKLVTGRLPTDPEFVRQYGELLGRLAGRLTDSQESAARH